MGRGSVVARHERAFVRRENVVAEAREKYGLEVRGCLEKAPRLAHRDERRVAHRIAIDAATDRRKCDRADLLFSGDPEDRAVARRELLGLAAAAAVPDRPDGVNDESRGQSVAAREPRFAGRAAAE